MRNNIGVKDPGKYGFECFKILVVFQQHKRYLLQFLKVKLFAFWFLSKLRKSELEILSSVNFKRKTKI